jgi:hypothetical protein
MLVGGSPFILTSVVLVAEVEARMIKNSCNRRDFILPVFSGTAHHSQVITRRKTRVSGPKRLLRPRSVGPMGLRWHEIWAPNALSVQSKRALSKATTSCRAKVEQQGGLTSRPARFPIQSSREPRGLPCQNSRADAACEQFAPKP